MLKLKEVKGESCKIEWCSEKWSHVERWESEERRNGVTWPRPHACLSSLVFYDMALYLTLIPGGKTGPPCVTVSWPQVYLREKTMQREEMRCPCSTSGMHGTRRGTKQTKQHGKYTKIGR